MNLTTVRNAYIKAAQEEDWAIGGRDETMSPIRACLFDALAHKRKRQKTRFFKYWVNKKATL